MPLVHITTCILCADRSNAFRLEEHGFEPNEINTGQIPQRLMDFQMQLLGHIQKAAKVEHERFEKALKRQQDKHGPAPDASQLRHLQAWMDFQGRTALAQGTAIMNAYDTTDPALLTMREVARLKLQMLTRRPHHFTDAMIVEQIQRLGLESPDEDAVIQFAKQMRDALLEQGQYAPKFEQPAVTG